MLNKCHYYAQIASLECSIIAEISRASAQPSTMGKKIWLSMLPRNSGSYKIVRTYVHSLILADVKCHIY